MKTANHSPTKQYAYKGNNLAPTLMQTSNGKGVRRPSKLGVNRDEERSPDRIRNIKYWNDNQKP